VEAEDAARRAKESVDVTEEAAVRVSVIVPVFNPGPRFDELIESLDRQTLSAGAFEVLLCDDGSDEETRRRLAEVEGARTYVRVLLLPHTGWPGTPRNHGIQAARGTYVFFADQDDRLFEGGLEQLCDYADRHSSDVVVGRVVGVGRRIPEQIFRRDVPRAVLGDDPLLELLTPHKLFRTAFLRENGIRFPDGRVRLEDHLFVMQAYFAARTISILASRPCYAWLKNEGSASSSRIEPETYFPHLETVLDLVEAHTEPGPLRDTLLRHWYRSKILKRMDSRRMLRYPNDYRARFLDVVVPIARRRFGPGVEEGLPFPLRIRSALLRTGRRDALLRLAQFESTLHCRATVTSARWTPGGRLALTVDVQIMGSDDEGLVFDAGMWRPPAELGIDDLPGATMNAQRDLRRDRVTLVLQETDAAERRIPGRASRRPSAPAKLLLDPLAAFPRDDPSTGGRLVARVRRAGWTFDAPLTAEQAVVDAAGRSPVTAGRRIALVRRADGALTLERQWPGGRGRDLAARAVRPALRVARRALTRRR
jgi:glycosyltransferase involved in cell wall biosynthesis